MKKSIKLFLVVLLCTSSLFLVSCNKKTPKNIILFIGDGMGKNHIENTSILYEKELSMQGIEIKGELTTFSLNSDVTDSAAAGTALATGYKTNNYSIGVTYENDQAVTVTNLCEFARKYNKKVGVVTTADVTDATPAAFTSHVTNRDLRNDIAKNQIQFAPDVLFGGYHSAYSEDLLLEWGGEFVSTSEELDALESGDTYLGLFDAGALGNADSSNGAPSILDMTKKSIELLSNKNGFFLMVEGAYIDKHSHSNNIEMMAKHVDQMDMAIEYAMEFAKKDKNTIVIVTADHETGALKPGTDKASITNDLFTSSNHSAANVPLFAYGNYCEKFTGTMDNTQLSKSIASLISDEPFGYDGEYKK